ncbi:LLM class F420-dependent oxidoreductase [Phytoactinopolyspora endophytica]|uniref:LLM class F420-dependent oxidoreductase n=1 Tax=Phytoactinopolyspora endophytica TaxID=1642495 RepID=UPI00101DBB14
MTIDVGRVGVWTRSDIWPRDRNELSEAASELEELGYSAAWFGLARGDLGLQEDVLTATSNLVAATGIINVWTEPAAEAAASFHRVSSAHPDRLLLGIGAGHAPLVERTGQRYTRPYSKVVAYLDELDDADVPVKGRAVAALGPRTVTLAGERSAGAHPYLVTPEHTRTARELLGDGPLLAPEQKVILETDRERAREIGAGVLDLYLGLPNYTNNLRRIGFSEEDLNAGGWSDRLFDSLIAWGDLDTVTRRIAEHHKAGADHVCVQVLTGDEGLPRAQWRELAPALLR